MEPKPDALSLSELEHLVQEILTSVNGVATISDASSLLASESTQQAEMSSRSSNPNEHVPRPANAFILFRSDLVRAMRANCIPDHRQQNMSRVAGQCWNLMGTQEKAVWQQKAKVVAAAHKAKYPNWTYKPRRRVAVLRPASEPQIDTSSDEYIRTLREMYTGTVGPIVPPSRPRKLKERKVRIMARQSASNTAISVAQPAFGDGQLFAFSPSSAAPSLPSSSRRLPASSASTLPLNFLGLTLQDNTDIPFVTTASTSGTTISAFPAAATDVNSGSYSFVDADPVRSLYINL